VAVEVIRSLYDYHHFCCSCTYEHWVVDILLCEMGVLGFLVLNSAKLRSLASSDRRENDFNKM